MVADLAGSATLAGGGPVGITSEIPALRDLTLGKGGRVVLIHLATGEQFVFLGPCRVRFSAAGVPEGAQPAESRKLPALQGGLTLRPEGLAQASLTLKEMRLPERFAAAEAVEGSKASRARRPSPQSELDQVRPQPGAPFAERVVYAALLDRHGRKAEARKLWKALAAERPGDARLKALAGDPDAPLGGAETGGR